MRGTAFLAWVLAFAVGAARAAAPPVHEGIDAAIKTFTELRENASSVIAPADRAEAVHALTNLSQRLDVLTRSKQALTQSLSGSWPQDKNKILAAAQSFKDEVRKTRSALTDVFAPLSSDWQTRGGDILTRMDSGFHDKWQSLSDAARDLGVESPSPEQFRAESDSLITAVQKLKELVTGIAADLSK